MNPDTRIYVKISGKKYALPVNPESIDVKHGTVDQTADIVGVGEILIPQKPGLREISWSGFFPGYDEPYVSDYKSPRKMAKAFEKAWKSRTVCRLIISRSDGYDTNMRCVISDWTVTDKGGEPDDLYYSVTFREYRTYGVRQLTVVQAGTSATKASEEAVAVSASTVRSVDTEVLTVGTVVSITGPYYSDSAGTTLIGEANGLAVKITRIEDGAAYPYRVGAFGWMPKDQLTFGQSAGPGVSDASYSGGAPWGEI